MIVKVAVITPAVDLNLFSLAHAASGSGGGSAPSATSGIAHPDNRRAAATAPKTAPGRAQPRWFIRASLRLPQAGPGSDYVPARGSGIGQFVARHNIRPRLIAMPMLAGREGVH